MLLAVVQIGSEALYGRLPQALGVRIYRAIDAVAPAGFVSDGLANAALQNGDPAAAEHDAVRMPAGPRRDEMLARVARARGEIVLAREYDFAAGDVSAIQAEVARLARTDVYGALALEARFRDHLIALGTHPDAVAESYSISGNYTMWLKNYRGALALQERALALAPRNLGYLLSAATDADFAGDRARANALFRRGLAIDPACRPCREGLTR